MSGAMDDPDRAAWARYGIDPKEFADAVGDAVVTGGGSRGEADQTAQAAKWGLLNTEHEQYEMRRER